MKKKLIERQAMRVEDPLDMNFLRKHADVFSCLEEIKKLSLRVCDLELRLEQFNNAKVNPNDKINEIEDPPEPEKTEFDVMFPPTEV